MKKIKYLPKNVLYLYSYIDDNVSCKIYRSRYGKTVYLCYSTGSVFSMNEKSLRSLSSKLYDYVEYLEKSRQESYKEI